MAEDHTGALWFGTSEGVRRYDGVNWTAYTPEDGLKGAPVNALLAARDGSVYAGSEQGISRFKDGAWRPIFPMKNDLVVWDMRRHQRGRGMIEASDGSLWAGTGWGALRWTRQDTILYTSEDMAATLAILAPDMRAVILPDTSVPERSWSRRWNSASTGGIGVFAIGGVIGAVAPGSPGEAAGLQVGDRIRSVDGRAFTASNLQGLEGTSVTLQIQREGRSMELTIERALVQGTLRPFGVVEICEARDGKMWFSLWTGDVLSFRDTQKERQISARLYTKADGLPSSNLARYIIQYRRWCHLGDF